MTGAFFLIWLVLAAPQTPPPAKQAVVDTSEGTFVIDLTPETAPNQVALRTMMPGVA